MPVDQPVELEIFIIVTERIDELFGNLEQTHVKEELKDGIDWNVKVNVQRHSPTPHVLALLHAVNLLSTNYSEHKKNISGQGDNLSVHHRNGHPVITPQQTAFRTKFTKFSHECFHGVLVD